MRLDIKSGAAIVGIYCLAWSSQAHATKPLHITNEASFHALGQITQVTKFDSFASDVITPVPGPYVDGSLSISASSLGVVGSQAVFPFLFEDSGVYDEDLGLLNFSISGNTTNMFSINVANIYSEDWITINIFTNVQTNSSAIAGKYAANGFDFHGYVLPIGEYFTGFSLKVNDDSSIALVSQIELGALCATRACDSGGGPLPCDKIGCTPIAVPEPGTWALLILGFGAVGTALRAARRRLGGLHLI